MYYYEAVVAWREEFLLEHCYKLLNIIPSPNISIPTQRTPFITSNIANLQ